MLRLNTLLLSKLSSTNKRSHLMLRARPWSQAADQPAPTPWGSRLDRRKVKLAASYKTALVLQWLHMIKHMTHAHKPKY